ncbi:sulfatase [uncultured Draconibacterium sp.]|uniref:sulfatase family protein n=1 Tax=uncultured Draconibacterium sp. TaxID=1573823 RepID=UPI0029C8831F|nr:sulfatase [uncultured Draconibacterium sp.]
MKYLIVFLIVLSFGVSAQENKQPNILWISCEDISPRLGCYGDPVAQTPNIDRLAEQGMRYTNVYTSAPVCAPCRSGIITGMYQTSIGTHHMRTSHEGKTKELPTPYAAVPPHYVKAFPEYLRTAGYYCTNNAKTDYQFSGFTDVPVSIWDESSSKAHYKNRKNKDQPFFAVFNYTLTHESKTWLEPYKTNPDSVFVPPYYPDTEPVRRSIARLYDNINRLDSIVGEHLKELEEEGLADNTIVFFWSDHGDGLPRGKRWLYDSGLKVPLIIRWPGNIKPGEVNDQLISSIDFGPTVLSLANVSKPYHMQGIPFLGNQKEEARDMVFSARDRFDESYDMVRSVRDKRYRYVRNYYPNNAKIIWVPFRNRSPIMQELLRLKAEDNLTADQADWFEQTRAPEELFDCIADPYQLNNLANDPTYKKILVEMRNELDAWQKETEDLGKYSEEELINRWYPQGVRPTTKPVHFIPNTEGNRNANIIEGGDIKFPCTLTLYAATQGASIVYSFDKGEDPDWSLYNGPLRLEKGKYKIRAKAIRYGYHHSEESIIELKVR